MLVAHGWHQFLQVAPETAAPNRASQRLHRTAGYRSPAAVGRELLESSGGMLWSSPSNITRFDLSSTSTDRAPSGAPCGWPSAALEAVIRCLHSGSRGVIQAPEQTLREVVGSVLPALPLQGPQRGDTSSRQQHGEALPNVETAGPILRLALVFLAHKSKGLESHRLNHVACALIINHPKVERLQILFPRLRRIGRLLQFVPVQRGSNKLG